MRVDTPMTAVSEPLTNEAVWMALNKLVLTRSNPKVERCYAILLFHIANGEQLDVSKLAIEEGAFSDPEVQEFLRLARQL